MAQLLQNSTIGGKQIASEEFVSNKVKTDVPANAKFTDTTYSEITEAEINTGTASTLRTITARRVTFILSKVSTLISNAISALTKNDVGLGNVDNIQQATKEEFNTHDADSTRHITAGERSAWNAKWDYNESTIKNVKVNNASNADTVNGKTVEENVPAGAKFTDTVYTHPDSHPASMITQSSSYRFVTDAEKSTWNAKSNLALGETSATAYRGDRGKVAYDHSQSAHAPSNAQKNSDITKAEIEAKLTGDITSHTHSAYVPTSRTVAGKALTGNITLTKGDVGLGNVDNTSDADKPVSTAQAAAIALKIDASKFQVVTELPASPVTGVFYFVKE